ncbi:MAG TPA: DUF2975 domain-containing protein [Alteraurantiacibacter sp.]|jgi:hypothetical protein
MTRFRQDPLLAGAKIMLSLLIALTIFLMAMMAIGVGVLLTVQRSELLAKLAEVDAPPLAYWSILLALVLLGAMFWLGFRFFRDLFAIIRSVEEGDPFRTENAALLQRMGWVTLGAQLIALVVGGIATALAPYAGEGVDADIGMGGGGILLILTLFILARVFRKGAEMREDLEGTV